MPNINILKASIEPIANMLAGKQIKVSYDRANSTPHLSFGNEKTGLVLHLPMLSDKTPPKIMDAIQGVVDHEVGHAIFSTNPKTLGLRDKLAQHIANNVEDVRIEREMRNLFKGSAHNLQTMARSILDDEFFTKLQFMRAMKPHLFTLVALNVALQATEGVTFYQELVEKIPGFKEVYDALVKYFGVRPMNAVRSTQDAADFGDQLRKTFKIEWEDDPPDPEGSEDEEGDESDEDDKDNESSGSSSGSSSSSSKGKSKKPKQDKGKGKSKGKDSDNGSDSGSDDSGQSGADDNRSGNGGKSPRPGSSKSDDDGGDQDKDEMDGKENSGGKDEDESSENEEKNDDKDQKGDGEGDGSDSKNDAEDEENDPSEESDDDEDESSDKEDGEDREGGADESTEDRGEESDDNQLPAIGDGSAAAHPLKPEDLDELTSMTSKVIEQLVLKAQANDDYTVKTTDYDKIEHITPSKRREKVEDLNAKVKSMTSVIQKNLERAIAARSIVCWTPGHRRGKLYAPALSKLFTGDDRVFRRREEAMSKDVAVSLVVDCSGSMAGDGKAPLAATAAYALCEVLTHMGIKNEVIGFTTTIENRYAMSDGSYDAIYASDRYSRQEPLYMPIFKGYADKFDMTARLRMVKMFEDHWMADNADGECVQIAAQRLLAQNTKGKIMIVLSDGYPAAFGNCRDLERNLKETVADLSKKIKIVGIGIKSEAVKSYYPKYVVLDDIKELPATVVRKLQELLLSS